MAHARSARRRAQTRRARRTNLPRALGWPLLIAAALLVSGFSSWSDRVLTEAATPSPMQQDALTGRARVIDGDTLDLAGQRVRLWGVDAPEAGQRCERGAPGPAARSALTRAVGGREIVCRARDWDDYGRMVAQCSAGGADLGGQMVEAGWAWDYTRYSGGAYARAERNARDSERGVWAMACEPAWDWRHHRS